VRYDSLFTRLVAQTEIPDEQLESTGCWLADGKMDRSGYVFITKREPGKRSPVNRRGHREMETIMRGANEFDMDDDPLGPILVVERPALCREDETIEHLCYNRRCWNPDHHTTMTRVENTRSMLERTRA
jgi:hypothetical protein